MAQIVIIGLGATGLSCCHYFQRQGMTPLILDTRKAPPMYAQLPQGVPFKGGSLDFADLEKAQAVVLSPGVPFDLPVLQKARSHHIPFLSDLDLFFREVKQPVVGITGSNGKSTVTTLLGEMARHAQLDIAIGGNLGTPALDLIRDTCVGYVLELSSFQLERSEPLPLHVAAFLNFSPDHLDSHDSLAAYLQAKQRIFIQAKQLIVNRDDPQTWPTKQIVPEYTFGLDEQAYGRVYLDGHWYLSKQGQPFIATQDLRLVGRHHEYNALAAMALADTLQIPAVAQHQALITFQGLAHRCQRVLEHDGVLWVNDSKATNIGATQAALSSLGQAQKNIILIAGGQAKGQDVHALIPLLNQYVHTLICFGEDANLFMPLMDKVYRVKDLPAAVACAKQHAKAGDLVLLSPACASLDMFTSYAQRGEFFVSLVREALCS